MSKHTTVPLLKHTRVCFLPSSDPQRLPSASRGHRQTLTAARTCVSPEYGRPQWNIKVRLSCVLISSWTHSRRHKHTTTKGLNNMSACVMWRSVHIQRGAVDLLNIDHIFLCSPHKSHTNRASGIFTNSACIITQQVYEIFVEQKVLCFSVQIESVI